MSATPLHHPSPESLAAFAAGRMRAGFDFVTGVHVRGCPSCRAQVARLESVGGALLDEPVEMSAGALEAVLARVDARGPGLEAAPRLEEIIARAKRRWVAPGVWTAKINTPHALGDRVYLLSVQAGVEAALHTHSGAEFTQVLSGALEDDGVFAAGDFCERDPSVTHRPKVLGEAPCVCLFATEGRLMPKEWIGRIAFAIADV